MRSRIAGSGLCTTRRIRTIITQKATKAGTHLKINDLVRNPPLRGTFSRSIERDLSKAMCSPTLGNSFVPGRLVKTIRGLETIVRRSSSGRLMFGLGLRKQCTASFYAVWKAMDVIGGCLAKDPRCDHCTTVCLAIMDIP